MADIFFWQTVAAVIVGNALCALSVYMAWRVSRSEKGVGGRPSIWVFAGGLIAPALVMLAAYTLPG